MNGTLMETNSVSPVLCVGETSSAWGCTLSTIQPPKRST